jgi:hypothetical protein
MILPQRLGEKRLRKQGLRSRVEVRQDQASPQKAHDRHFSTFTTGPRQHFQNDNAAIEPDNSCDNRHDRPSNHAGDSPVDREGRQLSEHTTFLLHGYPLGAGILGVLLLNQYNPFGSLRTLPLIRRDCISVERGSLIKVAMWRYVL